MPSGGRTVWRTFYARAAIRVNATIGSGAAVANAGSRIM